MKKNKSSQGQTLPTILIAAGGTGGRITPGISIAESWLAEGGSVVLATLMKNIEYPDIVRLARNPSVSIVAYDAPKLTKNPLKLYAFLKRFFSAYSLVRRAASAEHVTAVLGMGGYSSFPAVLFALLSGKPLYLCEQNAQWGTVTRLTKRLARRILLSFPAQKRLPEKFVVTGNPLRAMFAPTGAEPKPAKGKIHRLLFIGGSQGAHDLNQLYLAFSRTAAARNIRCVVATGSAAYSEIKASARSTDKILPFIEDMPAAYNDCDAVVARCGSGTLFEILWSLKPAFLIPYPLATADHQAANARALTGQMAMVISDHRPFDLRTTLAELETFISAPPALAAVSRETTAAEGQITRYLKQDLQT